MPDIPDANCPPFSGASERDLLAGILLASGGSATEIPNTAQCREWGYGKYTQRDILAAILLAIEAGGNAVWGQITGTLSDQTDLQAALNLKLNIADLPMRFDAADFIPRTTNGCGISSTETATNRVNRDLLAFDPAAIEFAQVWCNWPAGWNTFTATIFWQATSGTGSAVFGVQARIYNDGDAIDSAFGTAQTVTDAAASANTQRQTDPTAAITPAGTITAGSRVCIQLYRDATAGGDDLAVDALVTGILLQRAS